MKDRFYTWLAWRLPRCLVYWVLIRAGVTTIGDNEIVPEVTFVDVIQRWPK